MHNLDALVAQTLRKARQEDSPYYFWVVNYIIGNRLYSDSFLQVNKQKIIDKAKELGASGSDNGEKLYRGVFISPDAHISEYDLWAYPDVSFTTNIDVAKAFSSHDTIYALAIPMDHKGHIIELELDPENHFIWFDYRWNLPEYMQKFVRAWNQSELILGLKESI